MTTARASRSAIEHSASATERSADDLLEQARVDLHQIVYMATHDLRAPLLQVVALVDTCRRALEEGDADDARRTLELLQGRARRALGLHEDLLEFVRSYDVPVTSWVAVDVHAVARSVWATVGVTDVVLECDGPPVRVMAPPVLIRTMLQVLLTNAAVHHSGQASRVTVTVSVDAATGLRLAVSDDGTGVGPDELQRVQAPFERGRTSAAEGSGLGLSLVARACRAHGGDIAVSNVSGGGLRVEVFLPSVRPEGL